MSLHRSDIILASSHLEEGYSERMLCPACRGGDTGELSLSVTRDSEGLVWQCFRAKCAVSGSTRSGATFSKEAQPKKKRRVWEGPTHELPPLVAAKILEEWGITKPPYWYWTTDYGGRVAMSVRSPSDTHRGWVLRSLNPRPGSTKALTYIDEEQEGISWYKTQPYRGTMLVEDIPSAVRASSYVNSVALLGTGIGLKRAVEISQHATRPIVVALDQDATALSFKWARMYSLLWGDVKVLPLTKDMKDMSEDELARLLQEKDKEYEGTACNSEHDKEPGGL